MTDTDLIAAAEKITGRSLCVPTVSTGWLVWEQFASRGLMDRYVAEFKAAGIPAFFRDRKIGIKRS